MLLYGSPMQRLQGLLQLAGQAHRRVRKFECMLAVLQALAPQAPVKRRAVQSKRDRPNGRVK